MPTIINWLEVDVLIKKYLPKMTCVEFCRKFPYTIPRTIGRRAAKLNIKFAPKTINAEHKEKIRQSVSKYRSTPQIDQYIIENNGKIGIMDIASNLKWHPYGVRKRIKELNLPIIRIENRDPNKIRNIIHVKRIDWQYYDKLLKGKLPCMTITEFQKQYMPQYSSEFISKRAFKLNIKHTAYKPSSEHKQKISLGVQKYVFTAEQDQFMKDNINNHGQAEFAERFNVSQMAIWRRMNELGLKRSTESLQILLKEHGQKYGLLGANVRKQQILNMTNDEYNTLREKMSKTAQLAFKEGRIKPRFGISVEMNTKKGGSFRTRSSYETRFVEILESNDNVIKFEYEPFEIEYEYSGIKRIYNPDFLVYYVDHTELVEVKPSRFINEERNPAKFKSAKRFCIEKDLDFVIVTECNLGI